MLARVSLTFFLVLGLNFISAASAQEIRRLTAADLSVQTHKWDGKKIEVQLRCFYADKDEYRCVGSRARLDLMNIKNANGKEFLEENCDTISKLASPECLVSVRFVYVGFETMRTPSRDEMTVIIAKDLEGEVIPSGARRRGR